MEEIVRGLAGRNGWGPSEKLWAPERAGEALPNIWIKMRSRLSGKMLHLRFKNAAKINDQETQEI